MGGSDKNNKGESSQSTTENKEPTILDVIKSLANLKNFFGERLSKIEEQNAKILEDSIQIKKDLEQVSVKYNHLNEEVTVIKQELIYMKQREVLNDIIVTGLPDTSGENLLTTINIVLHQYSLKLESDEIQTIFRLTNNNTSTNNRSSPILIQLKDKTIKNTIFDKQKSAGPILLQMVNTSLPSSDHRKIYFKDRMIKENQILMKQAREFAKSHNYKYVWFSKSQFILLKQSENSDIIRISGYHDIARLEQHHLNPPNR